MPEKKQAESKKVTAGKSASLKKLEARVQEVSDHKSAIDTFIDTVLREGSDYGTIEIDRKNKEGKHYKIETKPTLFKAGAEKFANLDEVRPTWFRDDETWEMLGMTKGILCYTCHLKNKKGQTVGEGKGAAKTNLTNGGSDFDINKQVKIAKKRAFVDAILTTYSLSERFVQDLEDAPNGSKANKKPANSKVDKAKVNGLLKEIRPAINSLNMAKTPEQVTALLGGIVKSKKYQGKAIYLIKQHADKRVVALK